MKLFCFNSWTKRMNTHRCDVFFFRFVPPFFAIWFFFLVVKNIKENLYSFFFPPFFFLHTQQNKKKAGRNDFKEQEQQGGCSSSTAHCPVQAECIWSCLKHTHKHISIHHELTGFFPPSSLLQTIQLHAKQMKQVGKLMQSVYKDGECLYTPF